MRILALTGSSSAYCYEDQLLEMAVGTCWQWVIQSSNLESGYVNPRIRVESYFDLTNSVGSIDVLITHCGAGSVFWGLENKIPTIAIVNLSRHDDHQIDLGEYVDKKGLCLVTRNRIPLIEEVLATRERGPSVYNKIGVLDIVGLLRGDSRKL